VLEDEAALERVDGVEQDDLGVGEVDDLALLRKPVGNLLGLAGASFDGSGYAYGRVKSVTAP
jgi:hypothetical protein